MVCFVQAAGTETEAASDYGYYWVELALSLLTLFVHGSGPVCGWVWVCMSLGDWGGGGRWHRLQKPHYSILFLTACDTRRCHVYLVIMNPH